MVLREEFKWLLEFFDRENVKGRMPKRKELKGDELEEFYDLMEDFTRNSYFDISDSIPLPLEQKKVYVASLVGIVEPYNTIDFYLLSLAMSNPIVDTRYDDGVVSEYITSGYNPEWLEATLKRDDVSSVILEGVSLCDENTIKEIGRLVTQYSSTKPIIIYEDGKFKTPEAVALQEEGAILSGNMTRAGTWANLSVLMAQTEGTREAILEAWSKVNDHFGQRYVEKETPDLWMETEALPESSEIRYIKITPGMSPEVLESMISEDSVKGVVLSVFGAGAVDFEEEKNLIPIIHRYASKKPIIVESLSKHGTTNLTLYEEGQKLLATGVLSGGSLSSSKILKLLERALRDRSGEDAINNLRGELVDIEAQQVDVFEELGTKEIKDLSVREGFAFSHFQYADREIPTPATVNDFAINRNVSIFKMNQCVLVEDDSGAIYLIHYPGHKELRENDIEDLVGTKSYTIKAKEDYIVKTESNLR